MWHKWIISFDSICIYLLFCNCVYFCIYIYNLHFPLFVSTIRYLFSLWYICWYKPICSCSNIEVYKWLNLKITCHISIPRCSLETYKWHSLAFSVLKEKHGKICYEWIYFLKCHLVFSMCAHSWHYCRYPMLLESPIHCLSPSSTMGPPKRVRRSCWKLWKRTLTSAQE